MVNVFWKKNIFNVDLSKDTYSNVGIDLEKHRLELSGFSEEEKIEVHILFEPNVFFALINALKEESIEEPEETAEEQEN